MKKLLVISIYLVFGITLMQGNGVLTPSKAELLQIASKGNVASETTFLEIGRSPGALLLLHRWRSAASRTLSMETAFAGSEPLRIGTSTHSALPTVACPAESEPTDSATGESVLTQIASLIPTFISAPTLVLKPTEADAPIGNPSPTGIDIVISPSKRKGIPTPTFSSTNATTATTWATWTATVTGVATNMATGTMGVRPVPPSLLLDRLIENKPSVWGSKGFYVLLGALYLTLLGLFLRQIFDTAKRRP